MTTNLQQDQVLHGRFALQDRLHAGAASQLWTARDVQLETAVLLRVHVSARLGPEVIAAIRREALRYRETPHPNLASVGDVHEDGDFLLVSIDPQPGSLLATRLSRTGPLPFRVAIAVIRPLIEALAHLHETGAEHGRLDPAHVVVSGGEKLVLLPGDGAAPSATT